MILILKKLQDQNQIAEVFGVSDIAPAVELLTVAVDLSSQQPEDETTQQELTSADKNTAGSTKEWIVKSFYGCRQDAEKNGLPAAVEQDTGVVEQAEQDRVQVNKKVQKVQEKKGAENSQHANDALYEVATGSEIPELPGREKNAGADRRLVTVQNAGAAGAVHHGVNLQNTSGNVQYIGDSAVNQDGANAVPGSVATVPGLEQHNAPQIEIDVEQSVSIAPAGVNATLKHDLVTNFHDQNTSQTEAGTKSEQLQEKAGKTKKKQRKKSVESRELTKEEIAAEAHKAKVLAWQDAILARWNEEHPKIECTKNREPLSIHCKLKQYAGYEHEPDIFFSRRYVH